MTCTLHQGSYLKHRDVVNRERPFSLFIHKVKREAPKKKMKHAESRKMYPISYFHHPQHLWFTQTKPKPYTPNYDHNAYQIRTTSRQLLMDYRQTPSVTLSIVLIFIILMSLYTSGSVQVALFMLWASFVSLYFCCYFFLTFIFQ